MAESLASALVSDRSERQRLQDEIKRLEKKIEAMNKNGCEHASTCQKIHRPSACLA